MAVPSGIEAFSPELKQAMLSTLSDVSSLRSAALSCPSVYHAFLNAEELITAQVVKNQLDVEILPEAVAALRSSSSHFWDRQDMMDFIDQHLNPCSRMALSNSLTLSGALTLVNLHSNVERLASELIAEMLDKSLEFAYIDAPPIWPISRYEMNRVQRALYRFEVYCNLFRKLKVVENSVKRDVFFFQFSSWENEQFTCVYDYLYRAVCPAFNDIALHDISWGVQKIPPVYLFGYCDKLEAPRIQHLLSRGLVYLQQLIDAKSYEARHRLLGDYSGASKDFFQHTLVSGVYQSYDDLCLSGYGRKHFATIAHGHTPFAHDPEESGPSDAWHSTLPDQTLPDYVYSPRTIALRARSYCMWDHARLEEWGVYQRPWQLDHPHSVNQNSSCSYVMWESWNRRLKIWRNGGLGWWSEYDESKVVWPNGENPFNVPLKKKGLGRVKVWLAERHLRDS